MIYFDNSATSRFKPWAVQYACYKALRHSANPGRSGHFDSIQSAMLVENCRENIQKSFFYGNVAFTKNCTEALNLAIFGSALTNQVITTVYEHNSVLRPLHYLESQGKITLKIISPTNGSIESALTRALTTKTSMVALSGMSNVTGDVFDINNLTSIIKKHDQRIITLVDMAQAVGHIDYDYKNIDMITVSGHKGLHAPQGIGFLLSKPSIPLKPIIMGGTGTSSFSLDYPKELPEALEAGTLNTMGIAGLNAGLLWTAKRKDSLCKKINRLTELAVNLISPINGIKIIGAKNGIILLNATKLPPSDLADLLDKDYGIEVRSGLHCAPLMHRFLGTAPDGAVRVSIGAINSESDVQKLAEALKNICNKF